MKERLRIEALVGGALPQSDKGKLVLIVREEAARYCAAALETLLAMTVPSGALPELRELAKALEECDTWEGDLSYGEA